MKKIAFTILCLLFAVSIDAVALNFAEQSVLAKGNFVKIRVSESGICKLTYDQIKQMGLKPEELRIYGYGGAMLNQLLSATKIDDLPNVGYYQHKGSDNKFGSGDYILFYAQGPVSWSFNGIRFKHTQNTYSQYGYYFLTDNVGKPQILNINRADNSAADAYDVSTYSCNLLHEQELINVVDRENTGSGGGRDWYGETIEANESITLPFDFQDVVNGSDIEYSIDVAGYNRGLATVTATINSTTSSCIITEFENNYARAVAGSINGTCKASGSARQSLKLTYSSENQGSEAYLNYVEMTAKCNLILHSQTMLKVSNVDYYGESKQSRMHISGCNENTQVWDISQLDNINSVATALQGSELTFLSSNKSVQTFIVFDPTNCRTIEAEYVGKIEKQNLHQLKGQEMVIITPAEFLSAATELAQLHRLYDNMQVAVVTDQQVFNEFSSGTPDATAFRWLMKMLLERSKDNQQLAAPRYLLLFGDGTYDNRKLSRISGNNWILTYQARNSVNEVKAWATDDYFGYLDDSDGMDDSHNTMEISVGRLPINSADEAQLIVDKIKKYLAEPEQGSWRTDLVFLADDGDSNLHTQCSDRAAEIVRVGNDVFPANPNFNVNKIYLDAYIQESTATGETYPLAKNKFLNLLQKGVLYFNYCGHASYNNITNEQILSKADINKMTNQNQAFWMLATCNFGEFDSSTSSAAENAVMNPYGGAIGVLASCRTVYANQNSILNNYVTGYLFEYDEQMNYINSIGEAVRKAKNRYAIYRGDENRLPYVLLCDPALKLNYPTNYQAHITQMADTLKAMSINSISGEIRDADDKVQTGFNGKVQLKIYDKQQVIETLDNDQPRKDAKNTFSYVDYPNILFNGYTTVENGKFTIDYMVPKDIRYNYGIGKILIYALDTITTEEAIGSYADFIVGGSEDVQLNDTTGPQMTIYLNSPYFVDGSTTGPTPHFFANLEDPHGINTIGNGIGHDLILTIDNDSRQSYVLNEYYSARENGYKSGMVSYILPPLAEGHHQLTFRAWDLLNNSCTQSLNFEVVKSPQPVIYSAKIYPNPVSYSQSSEFTIKIEHDQPEQYLELQMQIYDFSGYLIYSHSQVGADEVKVNLFDTNMHSGIYLYRIQIKTNDNKKYTSLSGKMIVRD